MGETGTSSVQKKVLNVILPRANRSMGTLGWRRPEKGETKSSAPALGAEKWRRRQALETWWY